MGRGDPHERLEVRLRRGGTPGKDFRVRRIRLRQEHPIFRRSLRSGYSFETVCHGIGDY